MTCDFKPLFDKLSLSELLVCQKQLEDVICDVRTEIRRESSKADVNDYVSAPKCYIEGTVDRDGIRADVESLNLHTKKRGPGCKTQWLTDTGQAYTWQTASGSPVVKDPKSFQDFPFIEKTLKRLNKEFGLELNSCLVSCLPDGRANLRLHSDAEDSMDLTQPMAIITIGSPRKVDFLRAYQRSTEEPALTIIPQSGDIYFMKPGCQDLFKHRILADRDVWGVRFSLSFRTMKVASSPVIPVLQMPSSLNLINGDDKNSAAWPALPSLSGSSLKLPPPGVDRPINKTTPVLKPQAEKPVASTSRSKLRTSVLFGTSITEEVIGKRLGHRGRRDVINCSESGATIGTISDMVDNFANFAPEADDIEKVVLCLGTNDIKNATKGVRHLTSPLFGLINKVKRYFPGAVVLVFSTLPMKNMYWFTCQNFLNFNAILRHVCQKTNSYYVDCFNNFLNQNKSDYNTALFRDPWHLNKKGLGVLCSILKAVINCNNFSSIIRTEYIGYSNQY